MRGEAWRERREGGREGGRRKKVKEEVKGGTEEEKGDMEVLERRIMAGLEVKMIMTGLNLEARRSNIILMCVYCARQE